MTNSFAAKTIRRPVAGQIADADQKSRGDEECLNHSMTHRRDREFWPPPNIPSAPITLQLTTHSAN